MMNMNKRQKIFFILPYALIIASIFVVQMVSFSSMLTPEESQLLEFYPEGTVMVEKMGYDDTINISKRVKSPIKIVKAYKVPKAILPLKTEKTLTKKKASPFLVTMIVISEKRKMAIINNRIVNEYDLINNVKVARIEQNRVLLKEKKTMWWEYLKEIK